MDEPRSACLRQVYFQYVIPWGLRRGDLQRDKCTLSRLEVFRQCARAISIQQQLSARAKPGVAQRDSILPIAITVGRPRCLADILNQHVDPLLLPGWKRLDGI